MKRAIALGGGGTKGAYQAGFVKAIQECGIKFDIVTGTSIGALNGALLVQGDEQRLLNLWDQMTMANVIAGELPSKLDIDTVLNESNLVKSFFKKYIQEKGADITPLKAMIKDCFDEEKFHDSAVDYALVTVEYPTLKYRYITKDEMRAGSGEFFLLASASCFPAFPKCEFNENIFIDGGYYDNCPIELAYKLGADEVIAIDLSDKPIHKQFLNKPGITYIHPSFPLGSILNFDSKVIAQNVLLGYFDTMKTFKKLGGIRYTFSPIHTAPSFFNAFYIQLLMYDHKLQKRLLFTDDNAISTRLCKENYRSYLSIIDINFAMMDKVMAILQMNPYELYTVPKVIEKIHTEFDAGFEKESIEYQNLNFVDIVGELAGLKEKDLITKLIYALLFPDVTKTSLRLVLNVFSYEVAIAMWIIASKGCRLEWEEL